jgi:hypothetical protein
VTLCTLGSFMFVMFRRDSRAGSETDTTGTGKTGTKVNG